MAEVIGSAEIEISANAGKFNDSVQKQTKPVGQRMGQAMSRFAGRALKIGLTAGAAAVGTAAGAAVIGGFKAAVSRQNATKVLGGLYGSAKQATKMMTDLRNISRNSPIEYTAYQKAAQSLAYAGVEGKSATGTLRNVGKAIVAAGGDSSKMEQAMGGVMKAVNNGGIAMMDSLEMISDSGVPILSGLAEKFGEPIDVIKKMASKGQISIEDVLSVMQNGTGKTFQQMIKAGDAASQSFGNQWQIMKDNVVNAVADVMLPIIEKITPAIAPIGDAIVNAIGHLPAILSAVASSFSTWGPILATVVGGLVAYKVTMAAIAIGTAVWNGLLVAQRIATAGAAVQMRLLNAAFMANPIGIVIGAITLLVAGFILAYNKIGWFRDGVNAVWAGIKIAVGAVVAWFQAVVWPGLQAVWQGIVTGAQWLWTGIQAVWNGIMIAVRAVVGWFQSYVAPVVSAVFNAVGAVMTWLYQNVVKPVFLGIQLYIKAWWTVVSTIFKALVAFFNKVLAPVFRFFGEVVRVVFQLITGIIKIWWAAVKIIFNAAVTFIRNTLAKAFTWFRDSVIRPVWNTIKTVINTVWTFIKTKIFQPIVNFIRSHLQPRFVFLRDTVKAVWTSIRVKISDTWNKYVKPVLSAIINFIKTHVQARFRLLRDTVVSVWNSIKNKISSVWKWVKKNAFDPLARAVKTVLPGAFRAGKNAIGKAWDGVKSVAKKPVRFVISTVINRGIISGFNKLAGKFGVKKIDYMKLPKGFDSGGWTGPGRKLQPAGVVHADEFVIRKAAQRKITRRHGRGVLNYMNQTGNLPGHSDGGKVGMPGYAGGGMVWNNLWGIVKEKFPWARLTSAYRRGSVTASGNRSYHAQGKAVDLAGTRSMAMGQMMKIFNFIHKNYGQSSELIHSPAGGRQIKNGKHYRYTGAVKRMHYNHVHWANKTKFGGPTAGASGSAGGSGFDLGQFLNPFKKLFDKVSSGVKGAGAFGSMIGAGAKKVIQMPIDWITDKIGDIGDFVGGGIQKGVGFAKGQAWALARGVTGAKKKAMNWIVSKESGWNPKAQNPRSTASGLPQMINSTSRQYLGGAPAKKYGVWKQLDGMKKYTKERYGGWIQAANFWKKHHYYAKGGLVGKLLGNMPSMKPLLRDKGGILPPGMNLVNNATGRNEYVVPPDVTDALLNGNVGGGGDTYIDVHLDVKDLEGLQSALQFIEMIKREQKTARVRARTTARSGTVIN